MLTELAGALAGTNERATSAGGSAAATVTKESILIAQTSVTSHPGALFFWQQGCDNDPGLLAQGQWQHFTDAPDVDFLAASHAGWVLRITVAIVDKDSAHARNLTECISIESAKSRKARCRQDKAAEAVSCAS